MCSTGYHLLLVDRHTNISINSISTVSRCVNYGGNVYRVSSHTISKHVYATLYPEEYLLFVNIKGDNMPVPKLLFIPDHNISIKCEKIPSIIPAPFSAHYLNEHKLGFNHHTAFIPYIIYITGKCA